MDGDGFFIVAVVDAYITIVVDANDFKGAFACWWKFRSFEMLMFLLYNEYFVSNIVDMVDTCLVFFLVIGHSLSSALQFEELPVNCSLLPENHVHPKSELAWIVRLDKGAGSPDCPETSLDEMFNIFVLVVNGVYWNTELVT